MDPKTALHRIATALTGSDAMTTGVFVGSYKQHALLQEAIEALHAYIEEVPGKDRVSTK